MKNSAKNINNYLLFGVIVFIFLFFQIVDYFMWKSGSGVNSRGFFGQLGNNISAVVVSIVCLIALYYFWGRKQKGNFFILLIFAGAISNILDRFFYGGTIDYLSLQIIPTFNLADIFIVGGVIKILFSGLLVSSMKASK